MIPITPVRGHRGRALGALVLIAGLTLTLVGVASVNAPKADALSWRYYTIADGTNADRQVDAILYRYPSRATIWPQRRIATSYPYAYSNAAGLPCVSSTGSIKIVCLGWVADGPVNAYVINMGVEVNWDAPEFKDEGFENIRWRVYCNPVQAISVTLNPISCGLLSQTSTTVTLGYYFSTTTQAYGAYPQTTVWWRSYLVCRKYDGFCYQPLTTPAG